MIILPPLKKAVEFDGSGVREIFSDAPSQPHRHVSFRPKVSRISSVNGHIRPVFYYSLSREILLYDIFMEEELLIAGEPLI